MGMKRIFSKITNFENRKKYLFYNSSFVQNYIHRKVVSNESSHLVDGQNKCKVAKKKKCAVLYPTGQS